MMKEIEDAETIRRLWLQGHFNEAVNHIERASLPQPYLSFEHLFLVLFQGDLDTFETLVKSLDGTVLTPSQQLVYHILVLHRYMFQGNFSSDYKQLMEDIAKLLDQLESVSQYTLFWCGIFWLLYGNYYFVTNSGMQDAMMYCKKTLPLVEDYPWYSGNYLYIAVHNNLGEILRMTGSVEEALGHLELAKQRVHQVEMHLVLPEIYSQLGSIYFELNHYKKAIVHYQEGLEIKYLNNIPSYHALYLYRLFKLYQKLDDHEGIKSIHQALKEVKGTYDVNVVDQIHKIIQAEVLITKNRRSTVAEAQAILVELNQDTTLQSEFIPLVKFQMLNLLINELAQYGNTEVLEEINQCMQELAGLVKEWNSVILEIKLMIIQSKLELAQQNVEITFSQLNLALNKAQAIQNKRVEYEILNELNQLDEQVRTWSKIISNNPSIQQMLNDLELDEYVREVVNRLGS